MPLQHFGSEGQPVVLRGEQQQQRGWPFDAPALQLGMPASLRSSSVLSLHWNCGGRRKATGSCLLPAHHRCLSTPPSVKQHACSGQQHRLPPHGAPSILRGANTSECQPSATHPGPRQAGGHRFYKLKAAVGLLQRLSHLHVQYVQRGALWGCGSIRDRNRCVASHAQLSRLPRRHVEHVRHGAPVGGADKFADAGRQTPRDGCAAPLAALCTTRMSTGCTVAPCSRPVC